MIATAIWVSDTLAAIAEHECEHDQDCGRGDGGLLRRQQQHLRVDQRNDEKDDRHQEVPAGFQHARERRHLGGIHPADAMLGGFEINVDEQAGVIEDRRDGRGDADRSVGDLQELRHDEGGGAHHRRHELPAGRADRFDRRGAVWREPRLDHSRNGDDADREHVRHRAARDHAEQRRADHRDLGGAAAESPHSRHGEIGEEIRAAGARQHLAEDGVGDHHQNGDLKDRADHAVHVEADVGDHAFGRNPAGLEVAAQERADIDIGRDRQDDRDEAPAGDASARVQHQERQDGAADDALDRQHRELIGQRLVADGDVTREQQ